MENYRITYKSQRLIKERNIEAINILAALAIFYEDYGFLYIKILAIEIK